MKRQYFDISLNGSVVATTFAWTPVLTTEGCVCLLRAK